MSTRVTVELPDWVDERHIRIFAGIEEVARRLHGQPLKVKAVRCDMCGKCCMGVRDDWAHGKDPKTGWCAKLKYYANEYRCDAPGGRPFYCCCGDNAGEPHCCIEWKTIG